MRKKQEDPRDDIVCHNGDEECLYLVYDGKNHDEALMEQLKNARCTNPKYTDGNKNGKRLRKYIFPHTPTALRACAEEYLRIYGTCHMCEIIIAKGEGIYKNGIFYCEDCK